MISIFEATSNYALFYQDMLSIFVQSLTIMAKNEDLQPYELSTANWACVILVTK